MPDPGDAVTMNLLGYPEATSCAAGDSLRFQLSATDGTVPRGRVTVEDVADGGTVSVTALSGSMWTLRVPASWPSSLYRATFSPGGCEAYFAIRATTPGAWAKILISVPFATWHAYHRAGDPGESVYWTEQPDRAARVSFDRPGCGPPPERWEEGMIRWSRRDGRPVEYCSNLDLHTMPELLDAYRLLVVNGHDEYWSTEMRDAVEGFARRGGNIAFFAGNTCWWQMRLFEDGRGMICHRDAATDPMSLVDPSRVTVEWSSAPVNRPENTLTGVGFRRGAGCWGPHMAEMKKEAYTARFADHWVFERTGLADGDPFALGALGYETDAADYADVDGVPLVTGRDGTPPSFVILATADLRHWRRFGQGGAATMGIFHLGAGTVFNAATVNWGAALDDPVVDRITRNVLDRLSEPCSARRWEDIGPAGASVALAACEGWLFAVDVEGALLARPGGAQNLRWRRVDDAVGVLALASPREAVPGAPLGLYAVTRDGGLRYRDPVVDEAPWVDLGAAPAEAVGLACCDGRLFVAAGERLWCARPAESGRLAVADWTDIGDATGMITLAGMNGRLYGVDEAGFLTVRLPVSGDAPWHVFGDGGGRTVLTGRAGGLVGAGTDGRLRRRDPVPDPSD